MKEWIDVTYQRAQMAARIDLPAEQIIIICKAFKEMYSTLQKIENFAPKNAPDREEAFSGRNQDDMVSYGEDAAYSSCAIVAKGSLKKVNDLIIK